MGDDREIGVPNVAEGELTREGTRRGVAGSEEKLFNLYMLSAIFQKRSRRTDDSTKCGDTGRQFFRLHPQSSFEAEEEIHLGNKVVYLERVLFAPSDLTRTFTLENKSHMSSKLFLRLLNEENIPV